MNSEKILEYLIRNPESVAVLSRVLEAHRQSPVSFNIGDRQIQGFEWYHANVHASYLTTMVANNLADIVYKSNKDTIYCLKFPEATEEAISAYRDMERDVSDAPRDMTVPDDMFDVIVGLDDLKDLFLQSLSVERPVHIFMIGPPSCGKSLFLREIQRLEAAHTAMGYSATKAGVRDLLFSRRPMFLLIDELDDMDRNDYPILLRLMEEGVVSETLGNDRVREIHLPDTRVYAAANRIKTIPAEIIRRFTMVRLRSYTPEEYRQVIVNYLSMREGKSKELAKYIADKFINTVQPEALDVRDARSVARLSHDIDDVDRYFDVIHQRGGFIEL